jgi:hypothetical protein
VKKNTEAQIECNNFETLSEHIVRHIFKDTDVKIERTRPNKDGGYDIVVECKEGNKTQKVYFECKLRGGNINLRDIAANVIIAFNEGAVALVIFTNYNYTKQTDEHLQHFHNKTILNIKIIIGEQINQLVKICKTSVSKNLASLIGVKKSNSKLFDTILQINLSDAQLHHQFLYKQSGNQKRNDKNIYLTYRNKNLVTSARNFLLQGGSVGITGGIGYGKKTLSDAIVGELNLIAVHIDASLHNLQEHLLLDILLSIWGISGRDIIDDFTIDHIDTILSRLVSKYPNTQITDILRRLFGDKKIKGINNEKYNEIVCEYILYLLDMHHQTLPHIFIIKNLEYASGEIKTLLIYLITRLQDHEIPCIILHNKDEYYFPGHSVFDLRKESISWKKFKLIELYLYTQEEAVEYIKHCKPEISDYLAKLIVDQVGIRQGNITMFMRYLENAHIASQDYQRISFEIETLSPNHVPALTGKVMDFYRIKYRDLFYILFLLRGKVSENLLNQLNIDLEYVDKLVKEDILVYHNEWYICANPIVRSVLNDWGNEDSPTIRRLAKRILEISQEQKKPLYDIQAYLLKYLGKFEEAEENLRQYILQLRETRQLDALIFNYDIAIELSEARKATVQQLHYIIQQIEILIIKKEILSKKVDIRLTELKKILSNNSNQHFPQHYYFAYDYFVSKRDFKNGIYDIKTGNGAILQDYYHKTLNLTYIDNTDDWLGKLCYQYALCIKESQGNEAAWIIFQKARQLLPDSFTIWREYYSHLGCMKLYSEPAKAFFYYSKIVDSFNGNMTLCALPFHEYIDKAMSKLLEGDALYAEELAREASRICESNRVIDEWGRALNIRGCALLHLEKTSEALEAFKESYQMLKTSGYKLFCWRSQLNYIYLSLELKGVNESLINELKDTYACFLSLFRNKINTLVKNNKDGFLLTREYHALLLMGICIRKIKLQKQIGIFTDFDIESIKSNYKKDLRLVINNPKEALCGSPYFRAGTILMIG